MSRASLLAVDGGGSKVDAALVAQDGTVLGAARYRGPRPEDADTDVRLRMATRAVAMACAEAGLSLGGPPVADLGIYCVAGADFPEDDRRIAAALRKLGWTGADVVRNDSFAVLRSGTDRGWGVAVVCGAGTNCTGLSPDGRIYRIPALGSLAGDWGGGYDLGADALWYAIRAIDGRGEPTALASFVPQHFGLRRPRQVVEALHFGRLSEDRLPELAPVVFRAAAEGDHVARTLVLRQADEVVTMAGAAITKLRMTSLDVDVVLGGGIFRNGDPGFFARIDEGFARVAPKARVVTLTAPPVVGAALLGLVELGSSEPAHRRLRDGLTHQRLSGEHRIADGVTPWQGSRSTT